MTKAAGFIWGAVAAVMLVGCTPAPSPSPTVIPTPIVTSSPTPTTPTLSAEQSAAADAATGYIETMGKIAQFQAGADPNEMRKFARGDAYNVAVKYFNDLAGRGLKERGTRTVLTTTPSDPQEQDGRPTVVVSMCVDVRQIQIVDSSGQDVMAAESKKVASTDVTVQKWTDAGWFVVQRVEGTMRCDS